MRFLSVKGISQVKCFLNIAYRGIKFLSRKGYQVRVPVLSSQFKVGCFTLSGCFWVDSSKGNMQTAKKKSDRGVLPYLQLF